MPDRALHPYRFVALTMALVSVLLLQRVLRSEATSSVLLGSVVLIAGLAAAARLWFSNSFEAQFTVAIVSGLVWVGMILAVTIGLPGAERTPLTPIPGTLLVLPLVIFALQVVDYRRFQCRLSGRSSPYAP